MDALTLDTATLIVLGALFRRWWGGWLLWPSSPIKSILKKILGPVLAFPTVYHSVQGDWKTAAVMSLVIGLGMMAWIFSHAKGTWMGNNGQPDGDGEIRSVWDCFVDLWKCYFLVVTLPVGLIWYFFGHSVRGLYYIPLGLVVPVVYYLAMKFWELAKIKDPEQDKGYFLDHYTAIGELAIGALVYGGLAL